MPNVSKMLSHHLPPIETIRSRWNFHWSSVRSKLSWKSSNGGTQKLSLPQQSAQSQPTPKPDQDTQKTHMTDQTLVTNQTLFTNKTMVTDDTLVEESRKDRTLDEIIRHYAGETTLASLGSLGSSEIEGHPRERTWSV